MSENDPKAYKKLVAACDIKVNQAEFIQEPLGGVPVPVEGILPTPMGADCYGRFFSPDMETCMGGCPHMPLCKAICERRPDIAEAIDAIPDTLKGLHGISKEDALSALEATEAAPKKGKKAKKPKEETAQADDTTDDESDDLPAASTGGDTTPDFDDTQRYKWCGKLKSFEHDDQNEDELEMVRWLAKRKNQGFTLAEFVEYLDDSYDNSEEIARDLLPQLLELSSIKAID